MKTEMIVKENCKQICKTKDGRRFVRLWAEKYYLGGGGCLGGGYVQIDPKTTTILTCFDIEDKPIVWHNVEPVYAENDDDFCAWLEAAKVTK